jgi:NAD(P)-dependent dehydrogenase (short-subunit alcohol dehydrogenase family)
MAVELASLNINVNAIAPGAIETEMARFAHDAATRAAYHALIPMERNGTPEEIADAALFLASHNSESRPTQCARGAILVASRLEFPDDCAHSCRHYSSPCASIRRLSVG